MKAWILNLLAYWLGQILSDRLPIRFREGVISKLPKTLVRKVETQQHVNRIQKTVRESGRIHRK